MQPYSMHSAQYGVTFTPNFTYKMSIMCSKKGKGHPITGHEGPTGGVEV
jgi:hypothetical protein